MSSSSSSENILMISPRNIAYDESEFILEAQSRAGKEALNKCRFRMPESLLSSPMSPQHASHMLRLLPIDIILHIFDESDSQDQLGLALTCKSLLHISTLINLKYNVRTAESGDRSAFVEVLVKVLLRIVPVTKLGHLDQAWRLCAQCLRYRPTDMSYWRDKLDVRTGARRRYKEECSEQAMDEWTEGEEWECPTCQVSKYIIWGPNDLARTCLKCSWCKKWVYEESRILINGRTSE